MQQTEKYKLNLIEPSDPFLPDGLNANTQKVEDAMAAHEAAVEQRMDATDQRVAVLEAHKVVYGVYEPSASATDWHFIALPFTPQIVYAYELASNNPRHALATAPDGNHAYLRLVEGGFEVKGRGESPGMNRRCAYVAFV